MVKDKTQKAINKQVKDIHGQVQALYNLYKSTMNEKEKQALVFADKHPIGVVDLEKEAFIFFCFWPDEIKIKYTQNKTPLGN